MEKFFWMVQQECADPNKEEEFGEFLDKVHLPPLLTVPGIVRATRYVNVGPMLDALRLTPETGWAEGQGKNLAIYEIETEDIKETWKILRQWIVEKQRKNDGWRHPLHKIISRSVWRQASPSNECRPGS